MWIGLCRYDKNKGKWKDAWTVVPDVRTILPIANYCDSLSFACLAFVVWESVETTFSLISPNIKYLHANIHVSF